MRARGRANWAGEVVLNSKSVAAMNPICLFARLWRETMQINDKAPDFTLQDENGQPVSLRDFKGKNVLLYFFPKADTPG